MSLNNESDILSTLLLTSTGVVGKCEKNYPVADCSISLKFGTEIDNVTPDLQPTFKVKGSTVNTSVRHSMTYNAG